MTTYKSDDAQRDRLAYMLAEAVMGWRDASTPNVRDIATGKVQVDLHIESMVRGLVKQIWIDNAAISQAAEQAVLEAAAKVKLPDFIKDSVDAEFSRMKRDLDRIVREKIEAVIDNEIYQLVEHHITPHLRAKATAIVQNVWADGRLK